MVTVYCLSSTPYVAESEYKNGNYINPEVQFAAFNFKTFSSMASSLTFSLMYHHGLPMIVQPVKASH